MTQPSGGLDPSVVRLQSAQVLHAEAIRRLDIQRDSFDGVRTRAGTIVAATSLSATFLGAAALATKHLPISAVVFVILALAAFASGLGCLMVALLTLKVTWSSSVESLAEDYVSAETPPETYRLVEALALAAEQMSKGNREKIRRRMTLSAWGIGLLAAQVLSWLAALGCADLR